MRSKEKNTDNRKDRGDPRLKSTIRFIVSLALLGRAG